MAPRAAAAAGAAVIAIGHGGRMAWGQMVGTLAQEQQLAMPVQQCDGSTCTQEEASIVMDMNWRWLHDKNGNNNCLIDAEGWDKTLCPDATKCANSCVLEGVDGKGYTDSYQAAAVAENGLKLTFPKAPRVYMTEAGGESYKLFKLLNREFTFDVDVSTLSCGLNAALYFIEMPADGGKNAMNQAGAKLGTGYCDAQCPHMKFVQGKANLENYTKHLAKNPDGKWIEVGPEGDRGICCAEMDLLEANREAGAYTAHPCKYPAQKVCKGDEECGNKDKEVTGWCDKDGCGFNPYRMGERDFWGFGKDFTIDTSKPMTIVTQFITADGTDTGVLKEIRRVYIQDGKVIQNSKSTNLPSKADSITDDMCDESNKVYNATTNGYGELGGLKAMGESLGRGMVLSMSIWDDNFGRMLWLDAERPAAKFDPKDPGVTRGPCPYDFGTDKDIKEHLKKHGKTAEVTFSNIKYGKIGSTFSPGPAAAAKFQATASVVGGANSASVDTAFCAALLALVVFASMGVAAHRRRVAAQAVKTSALEGRALIEQPRADEEAVE